ncbi:MAG: hypothetical protein GXP62_12890, partial [Oligoflexia bacterium]|nr:hypothetical protein [Oligoflexia bacterium]
MSGSPTIAEIRMREAEERRLVEERRLRAEEERRRREEAERRARLALAAELRATLEAEASQLRGALATLRSEVQATCNPVTVLHVESQIDAAQAGAGDSPEAVARSLAAVRAIATSIAALRENVRSRAVALEAARDELAQEAAAEAQRLAQAANSETAVRNGQAIAEATALRARVEGIRADDVAMAWSQDEVTAVEAAIEDLGGAPDPTALARALGQRLDDALAHAQDRQLAEERRAYVVSALQDGLREQ